MSEANLATFGLFVNANQTLQNLLLKHNTVQSNGFFRIYQAVADRAGTQLIVDLTGTLSSICTRSARRFSMYGMIIGLAQIGRPAGAS